MEEMKQDKLPLDAKILSEAVIELNISRRSVGLYPDDHPIVRDSIERAFANLRRLFELRSSITLGVVKDALLVDEHMLNRKNPVFREFALSLHSRGIAAVTFTEGISREELLGFHSLITEKETPRGEGLVEMARKKNLIHISLSPIDFSKFNFVEGARGVGGGESGIWEDYIYGLLSGKLAGDDDSVLMSIPPEEVAAIVNNAVPEELGIDGSVTYDRVITAYLKRKGQSRLSRESFDKFLSFVDGLSPELKRQFLSRTFDSSSSSAADMKEVEHVLDELTPDSFRKTAEFFSRHSSMIPETLKNLIDKLSTIKKGVGFGFDHFYGGRPVMDDIEIDEGLMKLFEEDHFKAFVSDEYEKDLEMILRSAPAVENRFPELKDEVSEEIIGKVTAGILLELLEADSIGERDYLQLLTRLTEFITLFIETGRFEETLDIYNTIYSHSLQGRFRQSASNMIEYFFRSESFTLKVVDAVRLWGRKNRDSAVRLVRVLKHSILEPLMDLLSGESDPGIRKFLLSLLAEMGSDVIPSAVRRLDDARWYVVRNMIYLIRECGDKRHVEHVRRFAKDGNEKVCIEALRTLLHFGSPEAISYLKLYLQGDNAELRDKAVSLAGTFRVREAVPVLIGLLDRRDIFGGESYYKIPVVKALGEIGDTAAIRAFHKICGRKGILYRKNLEELKVEVYRALDRYSPDLIRPFIEAGLASGNEEIKSISEALFKKHFLAAEKGDSFSV